MVSFFKSSVVGLTIRKLVYFLDDILSYIIVLMIQVTSRKCSKVCVFWNPSFDSLMLCTVVEQRCKVFSLTWKATKHHYHLMDQGADGTVSYRTTELAPQNAPSWNRTSWFNRLLANPWRKKKVGRGSWEYVAEMGQCQEAPQRLEIASP